MTFHRWFAGFFLLILMVFALFVNAVLFSARSFQHNLAQLDKSTGGVISLTQLEKVDTEVNALERDLAPLRGELSQLERQAAAAQRALDQKRGEVNGRQARLLNTIAELEIAAKLEPPEVGLQFDPTATATRLSRLDAQTQLPAEARARVADARAELNAVIALEEETGPLAESLAQINQNVDIVTQQLGRSERYILGLKGQLGDNYDRIRNEARSLESTSPFGLTAYAVGLHPTFLSTILACMMGALGATLYLFPAYLNPANRITFVVIVVRSVFGMVAALAFYIVANVAGVALTGGSPETGMGDLNPFMVAFLGIIAGVMADDIAAWIMERGREILGGDGAAVVRQLGGGAFDPEERAASDARARATPSEVGEDPPRGGVVG